jgi:hypothetical protein
MSKWPGTPMISRSFPLAKESAMRPYAFIFRLSVLAGLVLASALMGGWKWELVHH